MLKGITKLMIEFDDSYEEENLLNLYHALYPYLIHPFHKIVQMCQVIITVILSIDRYVVVFYPYIIYRLVIPNNLF